MRNRVIYALVLAVGIYCIMGRNGQILAAPQAEVEPREFILGELPEGKVFEYHFTVRNVGDEDLRINPINVSCSCTQILEPKDTFVLKPQESRKVLFSFDTSGFMGKQKKYIFLNTNDPSRRSLRIKIEADIKEAPQSFLQRFRSFNLGAVMSAGLLDGFNPCAFTVLVFFISFLTFVGYKRGEMFVVGGAFILSVFLTYLLIGIGLFKVLMQTEIFYILSRIIYISTGILAIFLGLISFYDAFIFKKTKDAEKIKLKLPGLIKKQIHGIIREATDVRKDTSSGFGRLFKFTLSAFVCGFLVSLLESVCTGQIYVPTIVYILGISELRLKAFIYLVLYNLMFILPLVGIFVFGVTGVTSADFARFAQRHIFIIKFNTALIFLLLGSVLLMLR